MKLTNTNKVLKRFNMSLEKELKLSLQGKNTTNKLKKSIHVLSSFKGRKLSVYVDMEDYGTVVDVGRKPGKMPPINDIKPWIKKKGGFTYKGDKGLTSLAYAIGKTISKEGIEPTNFIDIAVNKLYPKFEDDLLDAYGDDILDTFIEE